MLFSVPATSANLGVGFDTLGLALGLRNRFSIVPSSSHNVRIVGEGEGKPRFVRDNTFVKIFNSVFSKLGGEGIFEFTFYNKIPISRGLGSSGAVVVGAVFSAFRLANRVPNKDDVLGSAILYENHPDNITSATFGGFNASFVKKSVGGRAEVVSVRKRMPRDIRAVVVVPCERMSTKRSRAAMPKEYNISDCIFNLSRASVLSMAFMQERWDLLRESSADRLHESRRMEELPILFHVKKVAYENGALMSTLSGSGSSILSLCYSYESSALAGKLKKSFPNFTVLDLELDNDGVKIEVD